MGAKHQNRTLRHVLDGLDEDGPAATQFFHHVAVMYDLVVHVHRPAVQFQGKFNDIYGPHHSGTKSPGAHTHQGFHPGSRGQIIDLRKSQLALLEAFILTDSARFSLPAFAGSGAYRV
jgi:hypothetical protein